MMRSRITVIGWIIFGAGLFQAAAEEDMLGTSIISRSPFIPSDFNPTAQNMPTNTSQAAAMGYEFRGVYQIGDRYWFLISEPQSRDGNWIELGKNTDNVVARSYDPETKSLTVVTNNSEMTLELAPLNPNPTPIPVKGLVKNATRTPVKAPTPVRRTIRPTVGTGDATNVENPQEVRDRTPAPAWLEKLRAEAAERRARAGQQQDGIQNNQARRRTIVPNQPNQDPENEEESRGGNGGHRQRPVTQPR